MSDLLKIKKHYDKAYNEHRHAIIFLTRKLSKIGYDGPAKLLSIGDSEYRTVFVNHYTNTAVFLTTNIVDGESYLYLCNCAEVEAQMKTPLKALQILPGSKIVRMQCIPSVTKEQGKLIREESLTKALQVLGVVKAEKTKKQISDCVETDENGNRLINYNKFTPKIKIEKAALNYGEINKVNKEQNTIDYKEKKEHN